MAKVYFTDFRTNSAKAVADLVKELGGMPFLIRNTTLESEWETQLSHGEKIGLGSRKYELITIK